MTGEQLKQKLCGGIRSFSLAVDVVKDRIGEPGTIAILPRWCRKTGRDVILMSCATEDGEADVLGQAGFINDQQAILDGRVVLMPRREAQAFEEEDVAAKVRFFTGQQTLFDGVGEDTASS